MTLRIGILSTARIARTFVANVAPSKLVHVTAVASRDARKAEAFARELGIPKHHGSYEALLQDPEVDAVYNPLPNSLHAEWSIRATQAKKHVLCEKPLASSVTEAVAMFESARQNCVHLAEGYPYRAQPHSLKLRELLAAGTIGTVNLVQSSFGFTMSDSTNIRLNAALGGGALLDGGAYPISLVRMVANARPARVMAVAQWMAGGVDRAVAATYEFQSGLVAQISCSFSQEPHRQALIVGTQGAIQTTYMNHAPPKGPAILLIKRGGGWTTDYEPLEVPAGNGFFAEAESFARLVQAGAGGWTGVTPEESIDIMMMIEGALLSARSGRPVDLESLL
ncbi:MAG TPA: Gfo/Idh/MocA family oxidoreductase [Steroidobacteraceae bacterium]|jgi:predicted dehydrogenase